MANGDDPKQDTRFGPLRKFVGIDDEVSDEEILSNFQKSKSGQSIQADTLSNVEEAGPVLNKWAIEKQRSKDEGTDLPAVRTLIGAGDDVSDEEIREKFAQSDTGEQLLTEESDTTRVMETWAEGKLGLNFDLGAEEAEGSQEDAQGTRLADIAGNPIRPEDVQPEAGGDAEKTSLPLTRELLDVGADVPASALMQSFKQSSKYDPDADMNVETQMESFASRKMFAKVGQDIQENDPKITFADLPYEKKDTGKLSRERLMATLSGKKQPVEEGIRVEHFPAERDKVAQGTSPFISPGELREVPKVTDMSEEELRDAFGDLAEAQEREEGGGEDILGLIPWWPTIMAAGVMSGESVTERDVARGNSLEFIRRANQTDDPELKKKLYKSAVSQRRAESMENMSLSDKIASSAASFASSSSLAVTGALAGVAAPIEKYLRNLAGDDADLRDTYGYSVADATQEYMRQFSDPRVQESFIWSTAPNALGSLAGFYGAGIAGRKAGEKVAKKLGGKYGIDVAVKAADEDLPTIRGMSRPSFPATTGKFTVDTADDVRKALRSYRKTGAIAGGTTAVSAAGMGQAGYSAYKAAREPDPEVFEDPEVRRLRRKEINGKELTEEQTRKLEAAKEANAMRAAGLAGLSGASEGIMGRYLTFGRPQDSGISLSSNIARGAQTETLQEWLQEGTQGFIEKMYADEDVDVQERALRGAQGGLLSGAVSVMVDHAARSAMQREEALRLQEDYMLGRRRAARTQREIAENEGPQSPATTISRSLVDVAEGKGFGSSVRIDQHPPLAYLVERDQILRGDLSQYATEEELEAQERNARVMDEVIENLEGLSGEQKDLLRERIRFHDIRGRKMPEEDRLSAGAEEDAEFKAHTKEDPFDPSALGQVEIFANASRKDVFDELFHALYDSADRETQLDVLERFNEGREPGRRYETYAEAKQEMAARFGELADAMMTDEANNVWDRLARAVTPSPDKTAFEQFTRDVVRDGKDNIREWNGPVDARNSGIIVMGPNQTIIGRGNQGERKTYAGYGNGDQALIDDAIEKAREASENGEVLFAIEDPGGNITGRGADEFMRSAMEAMRRQREAVENDGERFQFDIDDPFADDAGESSGEADETSPDLPDIPEDMTEQEVKELGFNHVNHAVNAVNRDREDGFQEGDPVTEGTIPREAIEQSAERRQAEAENPLQAVNDATDADLSAPADLVAEYMNRQEDAESPMVDSRPDTNDPNEIRGQLQNTMRALREVQRGVDTDAKISSLIDHEVDGGGVEAGTIESLMQRAAAQTRALAEIRQGQTEESVSQAAKNTYVPGTEFEPVPAGKRVPPEADVRLNQENERVARMPTEEQRQQRPNTPDQEELRAIFETALRGEIRNPEASDRSVEEVVQNYIDGKREKAREFEEEGRTVAAMAERLRARYAEAGFRQRANTEQNREGPSAQEASQEQVDRQNEAIDEATEVEEADWRDIDVDDVLTERNKYRQALHEIREANRLLDAGLVAAGGQMLTAAESRVFDAMDLDPEAHEEGSTKREIAELYQEVVQKFDSDAYEAPIANQADLKSAFVEHFGFTDEEAEMTSAIYDARAEAFARQTGLSKTVWYKSRIADVTAGNADLSDDALFQIQAYHGTPNAGFQNFDTKYIDTGEGTQWEGWGLYFTERESVAEGFYGERLADDTIVEWNIEGSTYRIERTESKGGREYFNLKSEIVSTGEEVLVSSERDVEDLLFEALEMGLLNEEASSVIRTLKEEKEAAAEASSRADAVRPEIAEAVTDEQISSMLEQIEYLFEVEADMNFYDLAIAPENENDFEGFRDWLGKYVSRGVERAMRLGAFPTFEFEGGGDFDSSVEGAFKEEGSTIQDAIKMSIVLSNETSTMGDDAQVIADTVSRILWEAVKEDPAAREYFEESREMNDRRDNVIEARARLSEEEPGNIETKPRDRAGVYNVTLFPGRDDESFIQWTDNVTLEEAEAWRGVIDDLGVGDQMDTGAEVTEVTDDWVVVQPDLGGDPVAYAYDEEAEVWVAQETIFPPSFRDRITEETLDEAVDIRIEDGPVDDDDDFVWTWATDDGTLVLDVSGLKSLVPTEIMGRNFGFGYFDNSTLGLWDVSDKPIPERLEVFKNAYIKEVLDNLDEDSPRINAEERENIRTSARLEGGFFLMARTPEETYRGLSEYKNRDVYERIVSISDASPRDVSLALLDNGIDAIRYRGDNKSGDYFNYVVFDDSEVTIESMRLLQMVDGDARGAIEFLADNNRAVITALNEPDVSTAIHELGHLLRRDLPKEDQQIVSDWVSERTGNDEMPLTREGEEVFAEAFEQYIREGSAPTEQLAGIFAKLAQWMRNIWNNIRGIDGDQYDLSEIRPVFDRLFLQQDPRAPGLREGNVPGLQRDPASGRREFTITEETLEYFFEQGQLEGVLTRSEQEAIYEAQGFEAPTEADFRADVVDAVRLLGAEAVPNENLRRFEETIREELPGELPADIGPSQQGEISVGENVEAATLDETVTQGDKTKSWQEQAEDAEVEGPAEWADEFLIARSNLSKTNPTASVEFIREHSEAVEDGETVTVTFNQDQVSSRGFEEVAEDEEYQLNGTEWSVRQIDGEWFTYQNNEPTDLDVQPDLESAQQALVEHLENSDAFDQTRNRGSHIFMSLDNRSLEAGQSGVDGGLIVSRRSELPPEVEARTQLVTPEFTMTVSRDIDGVYEVEMRPPTSEEQELEYQEAYANLKQSKINRFADQISEEQGKRRTIHAEFEQDGVPAVEKIDTFTRIHQTRLIDDSLGVVEFMLNEKGEFRDDPTYGVVIDEADFAVEVVPDGDGGYQADPTVDARIQEIVNARIGEIEAQIQQMQSGESTLFEDGPVDTVGQVPSEVRRAVENLRRRLGVQSNIVVVNGTDVNPDTDQFVGEHARGRAVPEALSMGQANAKAFQAQLSPDSHMIVLNQIDNMSAEYQIELLGHEIGHILEQEALQSVSPEVRQALFDAHRDFLRDTSDLTVAEYMRQYGSRAKWDATGTFDAYGDYTMREFAEEKPDAYEYLVSFDEWFAEQVARHVESNEVVTPEARGLLGRIRRALKRLWETMLGRGFGPSKPFDEWIRRYRRNGPTQRSVARGTMQADLRPYREERIAGENLETSREQVPRQVREALRAAIDEGSRVRPLIENLEPEIREATTMYAKAYRIAQGARRRSIPVDSGAQVYHSYAVSAPTPEIRQRRMRDVVVDWMRDSSANEFRRSVWTTSGRRLQLLANDFPILKDVANAIWVGPENRSADQPTMHESIDRARSQYINRLSSILRRVERIGTTGTRRNRVERMVSLTREPEEVVMNDDRAAEIEEDEVIRQGARDLRELLNDFGEYLVDRDALSEDALLEDYFPRVYDVEEIVRMPDRFENVVRDALINTMRENGADIQEADFQAAADMAEAIRQNIVGGDPGNLSMQEALDKEKFSRLNNLLQKNPSALQHRPLRFINENRNEDFREFLINDPREVLPEYFQRNIRFAEYARRFGAANEKLKPVINHLKETGNYEVAKDVLDLLLMQRGKYNMDAAANTHRFVRSAVNTLRNLTSIAMLQGVALPAIAETANIVIRQGVKAGTLGMMKGMTSMISNGFRNLMVKARQRLFGKGEMKRDKMHRDLHRAGAIGAAMADSLIQQRVMADTQTGGSIMNAFYKVNLLEPITRIQRIMAGQASIMRIRDILEGAGDSELLMRDAERLGLPTSKEGRNAMLEMMDDVGENAVSPSKTNDAISESRMYDQYLTAIQRLTNQSIVRPNPATRPAWGNNNHPFLKLMFQLRSFTFAYREGPLAFLGDEFLNTAGAEKMKAVAHAAPGIMALITLTGAVEAIRYSLQFDPGDEEDREIIAEREARSDFAKAMEHFERTGLAGTAPMFTYYPVKGVTEYNQSYLVSVAGPAASYLTDGTTAILSGDSERMVEFGARMLPMGQFYSKRKVWRDIIMGRDYGPDEETEMINVE